jgi:uncharacterized protein (DUF2132 family)
MTSTQPNNPLHGITLEAMLRDLVEHSGWEGLARDIPINCFRVDPSMTSALKYLRKAPAPERRSKISMRGSCPGDGGRAGPDVANRGRR